MTNQPNLSPQNEFDQAAATWDEKTYRAERAQTVAQGILAHVPVTRQMTALEYGCGTGLLSFALQPHLGQMTLADNSSGMLAVVDEKIASSGIQNMNSMKWDAITDPLPPVKFQLIYTLMTLHHILDTNRVLKAFHALFDSPGYLCVADLDTEDGSFHEPGFSGHLGFDREQLGSQAVEAGFRQVKFQTIFHTPRVVGTITRRFPVFLMIAEK